MLFGAATLFAITIVGAALGFRGVVVAAGLAGVLIFVFLVFFATAWLAGRLKQRSKAS